jgi:hypothetical protein
VGVDGGELVGRQYALCGGTGAGDGLGVGAILRIGIVGAGVGNTGTASWKGAGQARRLHPRCEVSGGQCALVCCILWRHRRLVPPPHEEEQAPKLDHFETLHGAARISCCMGADVGTNSLSINLYLLMDFWSCSSCESFSKAMYV